MQVAQIRQYGVTPRVTPEATPRATPKIMYYCARPTKTAARFWIIRWTLIDGAMERGTWGDRSFINFEAGIGSGMTEGLAYALVVLQTTASPNI